MILHKAGEDYLKTIYLLHRTNPEVRECDIAAFLGYSRASICNMVKSLSKQGYVLVKQGNVCLTASGLQKSREIYATFLTIHHVLTMILGVDEETATQDACHIEHIISQNTLMALKRLLKQRKIDIYGSAACEIVNSRQE